MAGLWPGIREVEHPAVGAGHCAENERTHKSLDTTGLLMEGTESNRRRPNGSVPTTKLWEDTFVDDDDSDTP